MIFYSQLIIILLKETRYQFQNIHTVHSSDVLIRFFHVQTLDARRHTYTQWLYSRNSLLQLHCYAHFVSPSTFITITRDSVLTVVPAKMGVVRPEAIVFAKSHHKWSLLWCGVLWSRVWLCCARFARESCFLG